MMLNIKRTFATLVILLALLAIPVANSLNHAISHAPANNGGGIVIPD